MDRKEYNRIYHKRWYRKNKEKKDKQNREWAKNHRKRMVEIVQAYVKRNKEKVAKYGSFYEKDVKGVFRRIKYRAKIRNLDFKLSVIDIEKLISRKCVYCGEVKKSRGIDRVNNLLGYTKENSVPSCKLCNFMKKAMSLDNFLLHIQKIHEFQRQKEKSLFGGLYESGSKAENG